MIHTLALGVGVGVVTVAFPAAGAGATSHAAKPAVTILTGTFTDAAEYTGSGGAKVKRRGAVRTLRPARDFARIRARSGCGCIWRRARLAQRTSIPAR